MNSFSTKDQLYRKQFSCKILYESCLILIKNSNLSNKDYETSWRCCNMVDANTSWITEIVTIGKRCLFTLCYCQLRFEKTPMLISKKKKRKEISQLKVLRWYLQGKSEKDSRKAKKEQKENHLLPVSFFQAPQVWVIKNKSLLSPPSLKANLQRRGGRVG